jgi:hypothetical protein
MNHPDPRHRTVAQASVQSHTPLAKFLMIPSSQRIMKWGSVREAISRELAGALVLWKERTLLYQKSQTAKQDL